MADEVDKLLKQIQELAVKDSEVVDKLKLLRRNAKRKERRQDPSKKPNTNPWVESCRMYWPEFKEKGMSYSEFIASPELKKKHEERINSAKS